MLSLRAADMLSGAPTALLWSHVRGCTGKQKQRCQRRPNHQTEFRKAHIWSTGHWHPSSILSCTPGVPDVQVVPLGLELELFTPACQRPIEPLLGHPCMSKGFISNQSRREYPIDGEGGAEKAKKKKKKKKKKTIKRQRSRRRRR